MRSFILPLFLALLCATSVIAEEPYKILPEVPTNIQTSLNVGKPGTIPTEADSINIGEIGPDYFILHGKRIRVGRVVQQVTATEITTGIIGEDEGTGGWSLMLIQYPSYNIPDNICNLSVMYVDKNNPPKERPPRSNYRLVLGK